MLWEWSHAKQQNWGKRNKLEQERQQLQNTLIVNTANTSLDKEANKGLVVRINAIDEELKRLSVGSK